MATEPISSSTMDTESSQGQVLTEQRWPGRGGPLVQWLVEHFRALLGRVPLRVELWNGAVYDLSPEEACATMAVRNTGALLRVALNPSRYFGDLYRTGDVVVRGNLTRALEAIFERWPRGEPPPGRRRHATRVLRRARRRAQHHYDLGNDFYRLWLDDEMVYTCAYFESPGMSLEQAQVAKLDYVCRKLRLRPGDRVLEAGCGWGALARHMALRYGAKVTACNVSSEQIWYARERAEREGFGDRVRYIEDDFRNLKRKKYDVFVSVGMLEHVGRENYGDLGRVVHERLEREHGRGLLHFIGRNRPAPLNSWIRKRIFPGAYAPSLGEVLEDVLEPWSFSVLDVENLRPHYVRTLAQWRERFEAASDRIAAMFDERFVRSWRFYLASSEAAFAADWLQLFQVVFARGQGYPPAWTRRELYSERPDAAL